MSGYWARRLILLLVTGLVGCFHLFLLICEWLLWHNDVSGKGLWVMGSRGKDREGRRANTKTEVVVGNGKRLR